MKLNVWIENSNKYFPDICIKQQSVTLTVQDRLCQDASIQDLYFNISEMKLSIILLFSVQIMLYLGASDIIYSLVIDSFISEILKYKSWILASWRKRSWTVRFTPYNIPWEGRYISVSNKSLHIFLEFLFASFSTKQCTKYCCVIRRLLNFVL